MRWLRDHGYHGVRLDEALDPPGAFPGRPVAITFDDGTRDFWEHARPVLSECGFGATLFIVSGEVGGRSEWDRELGEPARPLLDWDQIAALHGEGFEIASHTRTHRVLTRLSETEARDELEGSRADIERVVGTAPAYLAYPRGQYGPEHKRMAREAGYRGACAVVLGFSDLRRADRFELRRMTVKGTESMLRFRARLGLGARIRLRDGSPV